MELDTAPQGIELSALPRLTTTVPKEYVHRACLAEVFLTGCTAGEKQNFSLTGQWPRAHTLFNSADGSGHDPLQVAETFRQAGMFLAHAELGVSLSHRFVMRDLSYTTHPENMGIALTPTDFSVEAKCTEIAWRRGAASSLRLDLSIHRDGALMAHGAGSFSTTPRAVYNRLRANRKPWSGAAFAIAESRSPLAPSAVGRASTRDVVLSAMDTPGRWLLTPDLTHPIFFDHTDDHLPGMVLLEGARQAASAALAPKRLKPTNATTQFFRYAELDRPCWVEVTRASPENAGIMTVEVAGRQDGETVFVSTITGPTL
ncbi:ScbA/BarX family gamma-butyrolactone biosynthesis protein [Streptomyces sp. TLI_185]|uniref:ScbA/BarX family gamma-butyrolactone biosynthesis protein n=1 Tax=Streptomyces sp. TLI_185 TaxID=2485151 RepID=UPI000F50A8DE|nr:ScbA/BarX family gamma-butyrolactone biosynthesis protein [Streptomyces sp. TLI_185]RPF24786.1 A-factor biosynthesis hotdog protein [Streptomyces sp. TLI_185]